MALGESGKTEDKKQGRSHGSGKVYILSLFVFVGVGAATDSRQLLDSRLHGDYSHHVL